MRNSLANTQTQNTEEKQSLSKASIASVPDEVVNYNGSFLNSKDLAAFALENYAKQRQ